MPGPLLIPAALAAGAAVGAGVGLAAKSGQNQHNIHNFGQNEQYNPNAFQYGGQEGGARDFANQAFYRASEVDQRAAPQADYGQANANANNANTMRGAQLSAADMMFNRATGATPSIAGQQAAIDMRRAQAAQAAQASSARGTAGVALAGQQAANNTANAHAQISNNAQVNAAQERLQAEQAAFGAYGNVRGGDMGAQQQAASQAQFQSNQQLQGRAVNDARATSYEQMGANANAQQLQAQIQGQQTLASSFNNQEQLQAQQAQKNADRRGALLDKIFPSDMRSKVPVDLNGSNAQWERSFGPAANAQSQVRTSDNLAEMHKIQAGFKADEQQQGGGDMGAMMLGQGGGGGNPYTGSIMQAAMGSMLSDENAKKAAFLEGAAFGMNPRANVNPVTNRPYLPDYMQKQEPKEARTGLEKPGRGWGVGTEGANRNAAAADALMAANRSMAGSPYAYKPGMTPPGQVPGEPNVGPMAQNLEKSPVAATAVKTDPQTGLKFIDKDKLQKVQSAGIAALQQQVDDLKGQVALGRGGRK